MKHVICSRPFCSISGIHSVWLRKSYNSQSLLDFASHNEGIKKGRKRNAKSKSRVCAPKIFLRFISNDSFVPREHLNNVLSSGFYIFLQDTFREYGCEIWEHKCLWQLAYSFRISTIIIFSILDTIKVPWMPVAAYTTINVFLTIALIVPKVHLWLTRHVIGSLELATGIRSFATQCYWYPVSAPLSCPQWD